MVYFKYTKPLHYDTTKTLVGEKTLPLLYVTQEKHNFHAVTEKSKCLSTCDFLVFLRVLLVCYHLLEKYQQGCLSGSICLQLRS